jgi:hypothetical protein
MKRIRVLSTRSFWAPRGGSAGGEHHETTTARHAGDLTSEDLPITDMEHRPPIAYPRDGRNAADSVLTEVIDADGLPVAVDRVWPECRKDPVRKLDDVIAAPRATLDAGRHHVRNQSARGVVARHAQRPSRTRQLKDNTRSRRTPTTSSSCASSAAVRAASAVCASTVTQRSPPAPRSRTS